LAGLVSGAAGILNAKQVEPTQLGQHELDEVSEATRESGRHDVEAVGVARS
jgi:hypothetical protein